MEAAKSGRARRRAEEFAVRKGHDGDHLVGIVYSGTFQSHPP